MIADLPEGIDAPDIVARLSLFIEMAVTLHNDDYPRLATLVCPIVHEISLLLLKYNEVQQRPFISFTQYQSIAFDESKQLLNIDQAFKTDYDFTALPAHAGSHANFIVSKLAMRICQSGCDADEKNPVTIKRVGQEYWEVVHHSRKYVLLGNCVTPNSQEEADIVRMTAGPIGDYFEGSYPAININKLLREEIDKNKKLQVVIVDITSALYANLVLENDVIELVKSKGISLLFWESGQKFCLLHTDQAQYGRVFAYCHKTKTIIRELEKAEHDVAIDMAIPDVQIAAFIHKNCHHILPKIRQLHFRNGEILRNRLPLRDAHKGINSNALYQRLGISNHSDHFVSLTKGRLLDIEAKQKTKYFFEKLGLERESFGHCYTTEIEGVRISAGAESQANIEILAAALNYYITLNTDKYMTN